MPRTCAEIFADIPHTFIGDAASEVSGIAYSSRDVRPGDAFFCIVGNVVDGHDFAQDAIDAGAAAIVCERQLFSVDLKGATEVIVSDARRALAEAAALFYGQPSADMDVIGVTGTNGKTTVTYLVEHALIACGHPCGVIGTCGSRAAGRPVQSLHTTPESADLQRILGIMRDERCQAVAMEVSSHALALGRAWATRFAVTAFTNITHDHLDYHKTFDEYFAAKKLLFSDGYPAVRVISTFGRAGQELAALCRKAGDAVITVGQDEADAIRLVDVRRAGAQTTMTVSLERLRALDVPGCADVPDEVTLTHGLLGDFNTENVLVALGCACAVGAPPERVAASFATAAPPPGRMQRVEVASKMGFMTFVDYAHTPDALEKVISSARKATDGRLLLVFGCEGDRDRMKRPEMAAASLESDLVFLTNDNAHGERVMDVLDEVVAAFPEDMRAGASSKVRLIPDRKQAIRGAVDEAREGDIVLICGRGHEDKMMFGGDTVVFDDVEEARYALLMRAAEERSEVR